MFDTKVNPTNVNAKVFKKKMRQNIFCHHLHFKTLKK